MHELDIFLDHLDAVHPFIHFTVKKELNRYQAVIFGYNHIVGIRKCNSKKLCKANWYNIYGIYIYLLESSGVPNSKPTLPNLWESLSKLAEYLILTPLLFSLESTYANLSKEFNRFAFAPGVHQILRSSANDTQ